MADPLVVIVFRSGWRQPLARATQFEVFDPAGQLHGVVPADLVLHLLVHHLRGLALMDRFRQTMTPPSDSAPLVVETAKTAPPVQPRLRAVFHRKLRGRQGDILVQTLLGLALMILLGLTACAH